MATLTYPVNPVPNGGYVINSTLLSGTSVFPYQGNDIVLVSKEIPTTFVLGRWPLNGGTVAPARGGSAGGGNIVNYYWG